MAFMVYKKCRWSFLCLSHNNRESFNNTTKRSDSLKNNNNNNINKNLTVSPILIGNKFDLDHVIKEEEIEEIIK